MWKSLALLFAAIGLARADVTLAPLFSDHVVLQRDKPVPIWGWADPGEHVVVAFGEQKVGSITSTEGRWFVVLDPLHASSEGAELVATGKTAARAADVLVGDVWLCSGQSNMEFPVSRAQNAAREIASANYPLIRQLKITRTVAEKPAEKVEGTWTVCSPATAANFTAVGYFFARDLCSRLNVPIGLINCTSGGSPIEAWMSSSALNADPAFAGVQDRWKQILADYPKNKAEYETALTRWLAEEASAKSRGKKFTLPAPQEPPGPGHSFAPSGLFNGMICPLLPAAIEGALWYQGEANTYRAAEYGPLFAALIRSWRLHFGQGDFPFLWVQLANFRAGDPFATDWARLREAQSKTLGLPATGQAVTIDIGDRNDLHPRNKQEVGRRLALVARAKVYNMPVDYAGPTFEGFVHEGKALRVRFFHAGTALIARDRPLQSFQLAGADRRFYPATARIDRDSVIVSAPQVAEPVAVRYAWFNAPEANLYNGAGLPAVPFRSDEW